LVFPPNEPRYRDQLQTGGPLKPSVGLEWAVAMPIDTTPPNSYPQTMEMVPITDERMAQLSEYAQRCGRDTAAALDAALAEYLAWERSDFQEAVEGIQEGYNDLKVGRTGSAEEMFEELREKHGLQR